MSNGNPSRAAKWSRPTTDRAPLQADRTPSNDGSEIGEECKRFMLALDRYKRSQQRPWPTCSEILGVLRGIGYRLVPPGHMVLPAVLAVRDAVQEEGGSGI